MNNKYHISPTTVEPLGMQMTNHGVRFSVWAPAAEQVNLCIFNAKEKLLCTLPLYRTNGEYWTGLVTGLRAGQCYAYRAKGPFDPNQGYLFDDERLLIDPYTKQLSHALTWQTKAYEQKNSKWIPKGVISDFQFDWEDVPSPNIPLEKTIIYELHVKGATKSHAQIPQALRGTYLGIAHPVFIKYLTELGVNAVQLMPVAAFTSETRLEKLNLVNYWGYNPFCFMAPEPRYAVENAVSEFKTMVKALHRAGIEVILDVVFNHTAEGGLDGPVLSLKGLANQHYYVFESNEKGIDYHHYANVTGCGNTLHVEHTQVLQLVLDSLRYWVQDMHVDGFRFDLAVTLARERGNFNPFGTFFKVVHQDPTLMQTKLIAEPWDIGPGGYRLGQFPRRWLELNDTFRDRTRSFWRGDTPSIGHFAACFTGSRDTFPSVFRNNYSSINYVCYHDGFTLEDLVSYTQRYNLDNGEENRDGHHHNLSANYGVEGPTDDPAIHAIRQQQKRNFIATTLLAQGVPHLLAGDECGHTQHGNNNAYCQDNAISWLNWEHKIADQKLHQFTKYIIHLRQTSALFTCGYAHIQSQAFPLQIEPYQINWYHPDGHLLTEADWHHEHAQAFMLDIAAYQERWLFLFNASLYDIQFNLPTLTTSCVWLQKLDTATNGGLPFIPDDIKQKVAVSRAQSLKLLICIEKGNLIDEN